MEMLKNSLNWFEIPVVEFERVRKFYCIIYDYDMPTQPMGPVAKFNWPQLRRAKISPKLVPNILQLKGK